MTDPVKDPKVEDPKVTPPPTGDPPEGGEPTELPEHLKGKSPDELAKMVLEKESQIGKQSTEIGDLRTETQKARDDLNYLRGVEEIRRHQEQKRIAEEDAKTRTPQEDKPPWNYENPLESVEKVVKTEREKEKKEAFNTRIQENVNLARSAFAEGQKVMDVEKELYEGIEEETRQAVFQYYVPYIQQGYDVSQQMRDPKAWKVAAQNIRLGRGEVDKLKAESKPINPVSPTDQEVPGSPTGGDTPAGELDPEVKNIADQYGLKYEEAQEIIQEEANLKGVI